MSELEPRILDMILIKVGPSKIVWKSVEDQWNTEIQWNTGIKIDFSDE